MSHPTGEKRDEAVERAAILSDLRALVDMLENEPSLPVPLSFSCASYVPRHLSDELSSVAEVFAAAEKLDTEVSYNQREGNVATTWKRGSVVYLVYTRLVRPELDKTSDVITVTSPAQVLPTAATLADPSLRNGEQFPLDGSPAGEPS